jgi:hypothetical protein
VCLFPVQDLLYKGTTDRQTEKRNAGDISHHSDFFSNQDNFDGEMEFLSGQISP